jgi:hypothetical protein
MHLRKFLDSVKSTTATSLKSRRERLARLYEYRRELAEVRWLTGVQPVRIGHVPYWLIHKILRANVVGKCCPRTGWAVYRSAIENLRVTRAFDHVGSVTEGGYVYLVSEPYMLDDSHLEAAKRFADAVGIRVFTDLHSWHAPTQGTSRIAFLPIAAEMEIARQFAKPKHLPKANSK